MDKINLRKKAKAIRKNLPLEEKSKQLANLIKGSVYFKSAENIMLYYPTEYEINLLSLIYSGKNFYLPRVNGEDLEVCPYKSGDKLQKSAFNILEPLTNAVSSDVLDLIIVPALMCDKAGYRLGYGGGYYDRFLKGVNAKTICAIPQELYVETLPAQDFDIKTDAVFKV